MAVEQETILIEVEVDNKSAERSLDKTTKQLVLLQQEQKKIKEDFKNGKISIDDYATALNINSKEIKKTREQQKALTKQVDTTSNSLNAQRQRLSRLKKILGEINQGTEVGAKRYAKLSAETDKLNKQILEQEKAYGVSTRQVGAYEKAQGALTTASPAAAAAFQQVGVALRFLLSPIGLIIAGITLLLKAFGSTREGGQKLEAAMLALSTVIQKLMDIIAPIGEMILKQLILPFRMAFNTYQAFTKLIKGDFDGAMDEMSQNIDLVKETFEGWTDAIGETVDGLKELDPENLQAIAKAAFEISLAFDRVGDDLRNNGVLLAKSRAELENLRVASRNVALSEAERLEIAEQIADKEEEFEKFSDIQIAKKKEQLALQIQLNGLADSSTEDLEKEAQLQREVNDLVAQKARKLLEAENAQARLNKQAEAERQKRIQAEITDAQKIQDERDKIQEREREASFQRQLFQLELAATTADELIAIERAKLNHELALQDLTHQEELLKTEQFEAEKAAIEQRFREQKEEQDKIVLQNQLSATSSVLGALAGLFEQSSTEYKVLASAQVLIDTQLAIMKALATAPDPITGALLATSAGIQGASALTKINAVKFQDGGMINGASHANGGVPFTVNGVGGFEAEGGEFIVNKQATAEHFDLLNAINGGAQMSPSMMFANGGVTPNISASNTNTIDQQNSQTRLMMDMVRMLPNPQVSVVEFADTASKIDTKEQLGL
jgi:hypothetical protein